MSAYLESETHFNVVVSYFVSQGREDGLWAEIDGEWGHMTRDNAHFVAYELYKQNVRSVDERYREHNGDELYQFQFLPRAREYYTPAEIAGALDGLEYQSCETEDYHHTKAWELMCAMRKHLLRQVQDRDLGDETVWSIDEVKTSRLSVREEA